MKRELTPEQIDDLYLFCEENEVVDYDVQIELVDHLACAIEQKWTEHPSFSYNDALWKVYDEFGPSGFQKIKSKKEKELEKKYGRIQQKYMAEFFKLPKIIITTGITGIIYFILQLSQNAIKTGFWIVVIYSLFFLLYLFVFYPQRLRLETTSDKSFLLFKQYRSRKWQTLSTFTGILGILPLFILNKTDINPQVGNGLFAFLLAFFIIASIIMGVYIPRRIKEDFTNEFPQFVKS